MRQPFVIMGAVLALALGAQITAAQPPAPGPVTQAILDRGTLTCGVNQALPGFGAVGEDGTASGFEADWCRAVAAALLGDADAVEFVPIQQASEIPDLLAEGAADLITRLSTVNFTRAVTWGGLFGPAYFFDGQTVGVSAGLGISSLEGLNGRAVCVAENAPALLALPDEMAARGLTVVMQPYPSVQDGLTAFLAGECDALAASLGSLSSLRSTLDDPGAMSILPDVYQLEPSSPLSPANDPQFAEVVRWVVYGLIEAESLGITSQNVDSFLDSDDVAVRNLLGLDPETAPAATLGVPADVMVGVVRQVGNYGEIYERNIGAESPLELARGENLYWRDGGLLYAAPFR